MGYDDIKFGVGKALCSPERISTIAYRMGVTLSGLAAAFEGDIETAIDWKTEELMAEKEFIEVDVAGYKESVILSAEESKAPKKGYVYIVTDGEYVKIGMAKDVGERVRSLQTGNAREIILLQTIQTDDMERVEKSLHAWYAGKAVNGEWFDLLPMFGLSRYDYIKSMLGNTKVKHVSEYRIYLHEGLSEEKSYIIWSGGDEDE